MLSLTKPSKTWTAPTRPTLAFSTAAFIAALSSSLSLVTKAAALSLVTKTAGDSLSIFDVTLLCPDVSLCGPDASNVATEAERRRAGCAKEVLSKEAERTKVTPLYSGDAGLKSLGTRVRSWVFFMYDMLLVYTLLI